MPDVIFDTMWIGANWNLCLPDLSVEECLENIHSCTIAGSFEIQFAAVKDYFSLKIDYDTLMPDISNMPQGSRTIEILKYQMRRYETFFR